MNKFALAALAVASFLVITPVHAASRTLVSGMSGSDVVTLQNQLIAKGYLAAGNNTGMFGPLTLAAVKKFQCASGVVCSGSSVGVVGPATQAALYGAAVSTSLTPSYTGGLEFGGWLPYWSEDKSVADVQPHLSQMKTVSPFTYTMHSDGTINDAADMNQEPWVSFMAAAKAKGVRVVPTIMWGDGDTEHAILSNATKRVALEDAIAKLVMDNGYDGIDIDFEAKKAETKDYFSTFLKGLYQRMGQKWVYCSIEARMPITERYGYNTTPPADATEYANDYVAINKYCDRVQIMTYDQGYIDALLNAARAQPYVPVADPAWVENVINLAAQTIDKKKIIIGVPTYGYEYQVTSSGSGYKYQRLWAFNQGYGIQLATLLGVTPSRNSAGELSFIYKVTPQTQAFSDQASTPGAVTGGSTTNTNTQPADVFSQTALATSVQPPFNIVWWSDSQAIADKVALAKKLGIRGVSVFKLDGGEDQNIWNVLK
ncbi:MAG TPA: glycosyl hydrolase family 18 protein [Candidatus Paceibacterota bacterium]|nr:glycosyl hydrolase family 18 protein [Candidatus Paceibacterota bacterium]